MSNTHFSVVFADDDTDDHFLVQTTFRELNPNLILHAVYNGDQLIKFLEKQQRQKESLPDIIITDINMPIMNGYEAVARIKSNSSLKEIPVYFLTTRADATTRTKCLSLNAKDCFSKPVTSFELRSLVERILKKEGLPYLS